MNLGKTTKDVLDRRKDSAISAFDNNKIRRYTEAMEKKILLLGNKEDRVNYYGWETDFTHFDFMLSYLKFDKGQNHLEILKSFWAAFWPYAENIAEHLEKITESFYDLARDQDEVLKNYADQKLDLMIYQDFLKSCDERTNHLFNAFRKQRREEDEKSIQEAIKREEDRKAEQVKEALL